LAAETNVATAARPTCQGALRIPDKINPINVVIEGAVKALNRKGKNQYIRIKAFTCTEQQTARTTRNG
jgi:hypothetical protein